jgi:hypothetical protein
MTAQLDELQRLVAEEPRFVGEPDLAAIRHAGRRLRARRRVAVGVACLGAVVAVALPAAALTARGPDAATPVQPATSAPVDPVAPRWTWTFRRTPDLPTDLPDGCGLFGCLGDGVVETGEVVGEPWAVAGIPARSSGLPLVDEVIYAVRTAPGTRPVVAVGLREGDDVRRLAVLFRPGEDVGDTRPRVTGLVPRQGWEGTTWVAIGMVEEDPVSTVAWRTGAGTWDGAMLNDELVAGHGVFWAAGQWDTEWPADGPAPVTFRVDGREYAPPGEE